MEPALQTQNEMLALPATEYAFTHNRHSDLSYAECEPAAQVTQLAADMLEYFPAAQSAHSTDSCVGRYLPATHEVQLLCIPIEPALQTQNVMLALPATEYAFTHSRRSDLSSTEYAPAVQSLHLCVGVLTTSEYFPAAHTVHATDPGVGLYLPGTHAVQAPSVPVQPALQTQDVMLSLQATESAFTQSRQFELSSAE